jgi:hypothetical protein
MALKSFRNSIKKAKAICEAAAATAELTAQSDDKRETLSFPSEGVNLSQVEKEVVGSADPKAVITNTGSTITISTNAPGKVKLILKKLGVSTAAPPAVVATESPGPGTTSNVVAESKSIVSKMRKALSMRG